MTARVATARVPRWRQIPVVAATLGAMLAAVSGCSSSGDPAGDTLQAHPEATWSIPQAPEFAGPYAAEFLEAWNDQSNPDFVRSVIEDGTITDQEWAEVGERLGSCLEGYGIHFKGFQADGYSVDPGDVSGKDANDRILPACEEQSGERPIGRLRHQILTNPQNIPVGQIMAECLIRLHVVAPGYTSGDYMRDAPTLSFPYLDRKTGEAGFWKCNADPAGAQ